MKKKLTNSPIYFFAGRLDLLNFESIINSFACFEQKKLNLLCLTVSSYTTRFITYLFHKINKNLIFLRY